MISITKKANDPSELSKRKVIILSARIHPGETNSSWMIQGVIDFVLSDDREAQFLRNNFIIKIVPMINPDGVIIGNYRCNLNGYDLNRKWKVNEKEAKPVIEVWQVKNMIQESVESKSIAFFCDFHGHNRKHGIFVYGCNNDNKPSLKFSERLFPYMLYKQAPDLFNFKRCQFKIQPAKEGTGRVSCLI